MFLTIMFETYNNVDSKIKALFILYDFMKSFRISNLVTKIMFSSGRTRKLITYSGPKGNIIAVSKNKNTTYLDWVSHINCHITSRNYRYCG